MIELQCISNTILVIFVFNYTTAWVVYIKMLPIYHKSEQKSLHVYRYTISDYLDVINILVGVT